VPFVSFPYEWCFSQYRDAALVTLAVARQAVAAGMSLKDAGPFNIQFLASGPVLIDTLSFELVEAKPWVAYRQFCETFLAPLALMSMVSPRLSTWLRANLDAACRALPWTSRLRPSLLLHLHWHARSQRRSTQMRPVPRGRVTFSKKSLLGLLGSLESAVRSLRPPRWETTWEDYYAHSNYSEQALQDKERLVGELLDRLTPRPAVVWDMGANVGRFSRLAVERRLATISFDADHGAVERLYGSIRADPPETSWLPLVLDLANPSPGLGWATSERESLESRGPADCVLALALIHHLAIGNNVPLTRVAQYLARLGRLLIVEFVPKSDSQVHRMLGNRKDIFSDYRVESFEAAFGGAFERVVSQEIAGTQRRLYLYKRRECP
jgi:hypothetical protein